MCSFMEADLVLELVEGGDLLEHILKSETGLEELNARDITYQMCDALSVSKNTMNDSSR